MQGRVPGPVPDNLTVFETMRAGPDGRIALWPLHLDRLRQGCRAVGFPLDEAGARDRLARIPSGQELRVRLTVNAVGTVGLTHEALPATPVLWRVALSPLTLDSADPWLRIKTSHRPVYDRARAALPAEVDEGILLNERGEVAEGTITSVFLRQGDRLLTPPLACGLLPGVLRRSLIDAGKAEEALLWPDDLRTGELFMGNALRGLIRARLVKR